MMPGNANIDTDNVTPQEGLDIVTEMLRESECESERLRAEVKGLAVADGLPTKAALYVHAIKTIAELQKELKAELIFVVEDDHAILYAGAEFAKAREQIRGLKCISVWRSGVWLGDVAYDGTWRYRATNHDLPTAQVEQP